MNERTDKGHRINSYDKNIYYSVKLVSSVSHIQVSPFLRVFLTLLLATYCFLFKMSVISARTRLKNCFPSEPNEGRKLS